jgi:hypothetical protein
MDSERFYEVFNQLETDESKLDFMRFCKNMHYPYHLEMRPNAMIQNFYKIDQLLIDTNRRFLESHLDSNTCSVKEIANVFKDCFGQQIICPKETIDAYGRIITIIDCMEEDLNKIEYDTERIVQLLEAFNDIGVLKLDDFSISQLDAAIVHNLNVYKYMVNGIPYNMDTYDGEFSDDEYDL